MNLEIIIFSLLGIAVTLALLRWALSISQIVAQLKRQTDLLEKLAKRKATDPRLDTPVDLGVSNDDELNSIRATKLYELKKRYEAGKMSEGDYLAERQRLML